jgi:4-aminobutyrate aminotransferase
MPIGAVVARRSIMEQWQPGAHGNTYGGNPLACAAAITTIDLVRQEYMANAARMGEYLLGGMFDLAEKYPVVGQVRGKGLMIGMEFVKDRVSKEPAREFVADFIHEAFYRGLLLLPCGRSTIRFMPPLNLSWELAAEAIEIVDESIAAVVEKHN